MWIFLPAGLLILLVVFLTALNMALVIIMGEMDDNFRFRVRLVQGTYYIRVAAIGNNFSSPTAPEIYTLTVQPYTNEPADEHGDTFATAATIKVTTVPVAVPAIINLGYDIDYSRLEVTTPLEAFIFTSRPMDGGLDLVTLFVSLYDSSFNLLSSNEVYDDLLYPLVPGTYYVSVYYDIKAPYAFGAYTLNIQEYTYPSITCPGDPDVNDPLYRCQWHLENNAQYQGSKAGEDINVASVWGAYKGEGVHVAVVDNGMDFEHEDLSP